MECPRPDDHKRVTSLELQVAALKAELRAAEKREINLMEQLKRASAPAKVSTYELVRDAYCASPISEKDQEMRLNRGFSDSDLGVCLRVLHCIIMQPKLIPEYSTTLRVAKGLFVRPDPVVVIKQKKPVHASGRVVSNKVKKEEDWRRKVSYCKLQRDYTRELMKLRGMLPELVKKGTVSLEDPAFQRYLAKADKAIDAAMQTQEVSPILNCPATCWTCRMPYKILNPISEKLCPSCAQVNLEKRLAHADLTGKVAVITGGRIRIGFHVTLKLLRMGATVVVTTRFPVDCIMQLSKIRDFPDWKDRLIVYGLDMRSPVAVENFTHQLNTRFPSGIHILINNAAQTIAKPPGFYAKLMEIEAQGADALPPPLRVHLMNENRSLVLISPQPTLSSIASSTPPAAAAAAATLPHSVSPFGVAIAPEITRDDDLSVPVRWQEADQIDMRATNTWIQNIEEVSTVEMVEVQAVNVIAPFILVRNLHALMDRASGAKFVVNVSAMEGQFYRWKPSYHPHTNMGKAALNMMTRTIATHMAADKIHVYAVDTGWVTDEMPLPRQATRGQPFVPPLSTEDGAARILDPIIMGCNGEMLPAGVFYKDYKPTYW